MTITFRPHHFLCAFCYGGKGYSPPFVKNFDAIAATLRGENGDQTPIQVTMQTDDICKPCPHRRDSSCESQTTVTALDTQHAAALHLAAGDQLTWGEAKSKLATLTLEKFHTICEGCGWKKYGICEDVLANFIFKK